MDDIQKIFMCRECKGHGFVPFSKKEGAPYCKFPPLIGAQRNAKILFVGINPRYSKSNEALHNNLKKNVINFRRFSANPQIQECPPRKYIAVRGEEKHYRLHAEIVWRVFGEDVFEKYAAVTELFLCATENSQNIFKLIEKGKVCKYFYPTIKRVQPELIVALGEKVYQCLSNAKKYRELFYSGPILKIPHPASRISSEERDKSFEKVVQKIKRRLRVKS